MKTTFKNYLIAGLLIPVLSIGFTACKDDEEEDMRKPVPPTTDSVAKSYQATINMSQVVDGVALELNKNPKPYKNQKGQAYNVSRLQYLISDVTFNKVGGGSVTIEGYHYVDISDSSTLIYKPSTKIPKGNYSSISFTFGFDKEDNVTNQYPDLNIINWNWYSNPNGMWGNLGGGYHYMRLEGKYNDSLGQEKVFKTHMGKAKDTTTTPATFENNHLDIVLTNSAFTADNDFSFDLVMDIEQWYENTYQWDFNVYNAPIMPIYDAQKRLNENGATVFSIENLN